MHPFAQDLLDWYREMGRSLPWRGLSDPYPVWVSEIMLQQTQVATVRPYYHRFLERLPTIRSLADADEDEVLALWSGLGYYSRARNLHAAARRIRDDHGGVFPDDYEAVVALPGIGPSTAGAILSAAFNQDHAILDGNVKRVLTRIDAVLEYPGRTPVARQLWRRAQELTPPGRAADYNQAIMDLGATLCTRNNPRCGICPIRGHCQAHAKGIAEDLPVRKPAKAKRVRAAWLALVESPRGLLLERRPPTGFWGGLWCPPLVERETEEPEEAGRALSRKFGGTFSVIECQPAFRHTFSHFHLDLVPVRLAWRSGGPAEGDWMWARPEDRDRLGLPAAVAPWFA
ncbi:A/G-specific adenine glycosylase [Thiohalorhabdus sp.]|uniref:A/G-specific adenine glycosylase n=1 Tax=Thiohalorhabdus sp. TaxID=3094134 RepID=UPI002FC34AF8